MIWPQCCVLEHSRLPPRGCTPNCPLFIYWSLSISRSTYGFALVRPCVRPCVRPRVRPRRDIWRSAHQIFLKLGTKLHLGETKKTFQADFWKKFSFSRFWTLFYPDSYTFGSPDVFRLRKEPINSLSYVRPLVRPCVSVLQPWPFDIFFWFFAWSCVSIWLRWPPKIFSLEKFLTPEMAKNGQNLAIFGQNSLFWVFLAYIFQTPL